MHGRCSATWCLWLRMVDHTPSSHLGCRSAMVLPGMRRFIVGRKSQGKCIGSRQGGKGEHRFGEGTSKYPQQLEKLDQEISHNMGLEVHCVGGGKKPRMPHVGPPA